MRTSRFTEDEIQTILGKWRAGNSRKELCQRHGISQQTFSNWVAQYKRRAEQQVTVPGGEESSLLVKRAGQRLRQLRKDLGLSFNEVRSASEQLAVRYNSRNLVVWHGTVSNIESGVHIPTLYQLYSLSVIYRRAVMEILSLYGLGA